MSTDPAKSPALRASDADRDRVIDTLRTAVADGRLDPAEYDERVETALSARTFEALAPLTADLAPGAGLAPAPVPVPARAAPKRLVIKQKHGVVRRDGDWALPERLVLRTAWSGVELDLRHAVPSGPELVIDMRVRGGGVTLIVAPGMEVDANDLRVKFGGTSITRTAGDDTPITLRIRIVGRLKHGAVGTRWARPGEKVAPPPEDSAT
ncbi:protein of unknown function DUF1707 [Catenulispora acidiphila DSM 44928]|uniref:DUF1707 domain-containing protein n=1 Tax=Catenulispora acidiphila (strain DSM 44928 / JCM 14897 / NBRC 102108 / NRRL B-24433 / ID139908) TaxID=479433 RepID=C7QCC6_CATAD|nr:DUF1707 domain-containing protein [Catenulispora acidiphila]ACU74574.1 protein of unknown function DUF1707 [Catenulispora acidiphila DSM 44928]